MGLEALESDHKPNFSDGGEASKEAMKTTLYITKPQTMIYLGSGERMAGKHYSYPFLPLPVSFTRRKGAKQ